MSPHQRTGVQLSLIVCVLAGVVWTLRLRRGPPSDTKIPGISQSAMQRLVTQLGVIEGHENEVARTTWGAELMAQQCGEVFESLWDSINAASNKLEVLRAFPIRELVLPTFGPPERIGHGIELYQSGGSTHPLAGPAWAGLLEELSVAGWAVVQVEFRHNQFDTNNLGRPKSSAFHARADLVNPLSRKRATLEGDLRVDWAVEPSPPAGPPSVDHVDASRLRLLMRAGEPPFQQVLLEELAPVEKSHFIDPLLLYDLGGDGLSEIILAAKNLVFQRQPDGTYASRRLLAHTPGLIFTGIIADFDGDGHADFLGATFEGLMLFKGSPTGTFEEPGRLVWAAHPHLKYAQALTCGDIDQDGDLDVWLGQYKNPYERGQMPTPYYDANDGNPAYLLLNDGKGNFSDATEASGLGKKRWRRCYSGSFVDLNGDGHLDLLVVSDFAGVDVYGNDGHGHFTDMTDQWLGERHMFGMGHTLADFNADGRLDFLVTGMHCPTAQRLDHLGLKRPGRSDYEAMRPRTTDGNRLFLGQPGGGFQAGPLSASISRSGWSWGCGALDWDNDGYPDVFIANGHETRQSVKDYEPEFWLHDIYVGDSRDDVVKNAYFGAKAGRTRGRGQSYGGYEMNRFFINRRGESFLEAGHLLGLALQQDSRNVATDDLDGDGRVDLLVTTFEVWPRVKQTLRVFRNNLDSGGNWIGFRFREEGNGVSPVGARVTLEYAGKRVTGQIVTGDSHRAQHANTLHFGLGPSSSIESAEIRWQNGQTLKLVNPAINRYHAISLAR